MMFHPATLCRPRKQGFVQCTACEHWCAVAPGAAGKCGVRRNLDGTLRLVVYGKVIVRNGYHVRTLWSEPGICPHCGARLAGVWQ